MMKKVMLAITVATLVGTGCAQMAAAGTPQNATNTAGGIQSGDLAQLNTLLLQLDQASRGATAELARLRIDKWKTGGDVKQQSQANVDSLQRNLTTALPEIENKVRQAPQDMSANFKLYRNLNALYDVFASVAESAGAFGPKEQYEALAQQASTFDQVRRSVADRLEQLAVAKEMELARLRNLTKAQTQPQAQQGPKKIIVDDNEPVRKPKKKKPSSIPQS
jgi:hypothetical protein